MRTEIAYRIPGSEGRVRPEARRDEFVREDGPARGPTDHVATHHRSQIGAYSGSTPSAIVQPQESKSGLENPT
jgi:hypothetical protein